MGTLRRVFSGLMAVCRFGGWRVEDGREGGLEFGQNYVLGKEKIMK